MTRRKPEKTTPRSATQLSIAFPGPSGLPALEAPKKFRFVDLFAGIGGFHIGFSAIHGTCVFTSEWNQPARLTYEKNFRPRHLIVGDIRPIGPDQVPPFDVLLAGFPCQPFSIAGVSKKNALGHPHGFDCQTQGTLFFEIEKLLRFHRPAAFLLENVKNLLRHDRGRTFEVIRRVLEDDLGYHVSVRVIDARYWVPQHRERVFIAGFLPPSTFDFHEMALPDLQDAPVLSSFLHPEDGSQLPEDPFTVGKNAKVNEKYVLSDHLWQYLKDYAAKHREAGNGFGFGLVTKNDVARTLSARYFKDGSEILVSRGEKNPRRLTPRECAWIMGFDRPGKQRFKIEVSDTQAYRQFGNAVVPPAVRWIATFMAPHIGRAMKIRTKHWVGTPSKSHGRRLHAAKT